MYSIPHDNTDSTYLEPDTLVPRYPDTHQHIICSLWLARGFVCSIGDGMWTHQGDTHTTHRQLFLKAAVSVVDRQQNKIVLFFFFLILR